MTISVPRIVLLTAGDLDLGEAHQAHATAWLARLSSRIGLWCARSRQRRALSDLSECNSHLLLDIGITPEAASREAAKWFWQK
jgi:uncharacterized protein YjiS (DUF1127 family)